MNNKWVVTIGREFCSGGADTGRLLAEKLGYSFIDKELVAEVTDELGLIEAEVEAMEEIPEIPRELPFQWSGSHKWFKEDGTANIPMTRQIMNAQTRVINAYGRKGECVIVGRMADYILKGRPYLLNVFFVSSLENRVARCMERFQLSEKKADKHVRKIDKMRSEYYGHYTDKIWAMPYCYDMYIDLGEVGPEAACEMIIKKMEELDS